MADYVKPLYSGDVRDGVLVLLCDGAGVCTILVGT